MGTPGIPPIQVLAVEVNFPSGPEAGNPIKVQPAADYLSIGQPLPAQGVNYWNNGLSVAALNNQNLVVSLAIGNWDAAVAGTTIDASLSYISCVLYQPHTQKWLVFETQTGGGFLTWSTHDNGHTWASEAPTQGGSIVLGGVAVPGTSDYMVFIAGGFVCNQANTLTTVGALAAAGSGGTNGLKVAMFTQGPGVAFVGLSLSGATYTGYYATGNSLGTSWSGASSSLPAAWQTGTCHVTRGVTSCQSTAATDGSGPRTLVAMCGTTPGTDVGRLLVVSSSGTFTDSSPSFMATKVVTGMAYGANDNLWGVLCHDGTNSYLYTSPDPTGVTTPYTLVKTFAGSTLSGGLAVLGYVWVAQCEISGDPRTMYSGDVGSDGAASQWGTANANIADAWDIGSGQSGLVSSGAGLCTFNHAYVSFSKQLGLMASGAI